MCSFGYLRELQVDYLKIAGAFVRDMATDPIARATVEAINGVGQRLGIRTVAEHVSMTEVLELARRFGVNYAQGHAVALPAPFETCLERRGPAPERGALGLSRGREPLDELEGREREHEDDAEEDQVAVLEARPARALDPVERPVRDEVEAGADQREVDDLHAGSLPRRAARAT